MPSSMKLLQKRLAIREQRMAVIEKARGSKGECQGRIISKDPIQLPAASTVWKERDSLRITKREWARAPEVTPLTHLRGRAYLKDLNKLLQFTVDGVEPKIEVLNLSVYPARERRVFPQAELTKLLSCAHSAFQVNLSGCVQFEDDLVMSISHEVKELNLSGCKKITDLAGVYLSLINSLKSLDISNCPKITDHFFANFGFQTGLGYLNIKGCKGISPTVIDFFIKYNPKCTVEHD